MRRFALIVVFLAALVFVAPAGAEVPLTKQPAPVVKTYQRAVNAFYDRFDIPRAPIRVTGNRDRATKDGIKDVKYLQGLSQGYVKWATGTNAVFLKRTVHPTYLLSKVAVKRGLDRRAAARHMTTSTRGVTFIADFEGFFPGTYNDPAPSHNCTAYYGHLIHQGPCTIADAARWPIKTRQEALAYLRVDLKPYEKRVEGSVRVPLSQCKFDALVSFDFNTGALKVSTLLLKLNNGDIAGAANEFLRWVKAGSQTLPGLVRRRHDERAVFLRC